MHAHPAFIFRGDPANAPSYLDHLDTAFAGPISPAGRAARSPQAARGGPGDGIGGPGELEEGQQAMLEGRTEQAIASFQESLKQNAALACNHLSLAAAHLARGEDEQAADQLQRYLQARPDHFVVRGQYAELLRRLDRLGEARDQFEHFEADIQDHEELIPQHMVHCHSRLMDIATTIEDDYARHLHRGIGLYWLARQRRAGR